MAEYARGLDSSSEDYSAHNKKEQVAYRSRLPKVDFNELNFEQRRTAYDSSKGNGRNGDSGPQNRPDDVGKRRDEL